MGKKENKNLETPKKEKKTVKTEKTKSEVKTQKSEETQKENKFAFFKKAGEVLRKRWLVNGYKTIIMIAIIVAIYMGVNILLNKVVLPEIDCTKEKMYSISDETKDKVGEIEKEVTITLINYGDKSSVTSFIEKYPGVNKNIKIERVDDLSARSELMTKYSLESTDSLIVISTDNNEKTLDTYDLTTYDYTTGKSIDKTEEAITNAILDVATDEKTKIYFSSTHLEYDLRYYSTIMTAMEEEANEVERIDILANGRVPEDCDVLVLSTLKEDLTELERDKIIEYIKNGGEILLMCGPNISNANLTNFQAVLDEYGITISNGVLFEGKSSNMMSGYPDMIVEETQSTELTSKLKTTSICLVDAGKLEFNEDKLEELGVTYETLATTSAQAFLRTNLNQQSVSRTSEDGEEEESMVAAVVTKKLDEDKNSKVVIFTNELFAMDTPIQIQQYTQYVVNLYNNRDLILNSVSYLAEKENTITIRKSADEVTYTVTEEQHNIILAIIFAVPVVIIAIGIGVWQVRRRKK